MGVKLTVRVVVEVPAPPRLPAGFYPLAVEVYSYARGTRMKAFKVPADRRSWAAGTRAAVCKALEAACRECGIEESFIIVLASGPGGRWVEVVFDGTERTWTVGEIQGGKSR